MGRREPASPAANCPPRTVRGRAVSLSQGFSSLHARTPPSSADVFCGMVSCSYQIENVECGTRGKDKLPEERVPPGQRFVERLAS